MKILQVCKKVPFPPRDGETIAIHSLASAFNDLGHEVTIAAINTRKHHIDAGALNEDYGKIAEVFTADVNTSVHPIGALKNLFSQQSYHIQRFDSQAFHQLLINLLSKKEFDIVQLEGLYLSPYVKTIRAHSKARIVMRSHNVESEIWQRLADNHPFGLKKKYLQLLVNRLRQYEISQINDFDAHVPITPRDQEWFLQMGARVPVKTIPTGIDPAKYIPDHSQVHFPSVFIFGSLDWRPNQEGILWFIEQVWPKVVKRNEGLKLFIAGRSAPEWMNRLKGRSIEMVGEVDSALDFYKSKAIMAVPLLSGSGMRIKIIEALAMEKPIVSTCIGAEGLGCKSGKHLLIADKPDQFANAIQRCLDDVNLCFQLGKDGRRFVETKYNYLNLAEDLIRFYQTSVL